jgi:nitroreductase
MAAPAIIIPVADPLAYATRYGEPDKAGTLLSDKAPDVWPTPFWLVDSAFAAMLVLLAATDQGVGALFFQFHNDSSSVARALSLPEGRELIGAIAVGFPAGDDAPTSPSRRERRRLEDVVHLEEW